MTAPRCRYCGAPLPDGEPGPCADKRGCEGRREMRVHLSQIAEWEAVAIEDERRRLRGGMR